MKQIYILLIALLMSLSANAEKSGSCGPNLKWHLTDDGVLTISGEGRMDNYDGGYYVGGPWRYDDIKRVIIGDSVTSIGNDAFRGCSSLTSVTIPNSVRAIGYGAFSDCSSLTSVTIPNSVTTIGKEVFRDCSSLTSVTIPNSVTTIGEYALSNCSSLTSVTIGNSVTTIGGGAFFDCTSLTSVTIGNSVTTIGKDAFGVCSSLTSVTIPNCVTTIGNDAFSYCSSLTSVTIGNSVTTIGKEVFRDCSSLTSVTIPNSVTTIEYSAFNGCSSLTSVTIPNSVTTIGNSAFSGCSSLTSVTIPNSVTAIGDNAFYNTNMTKIIWLTNTPPDGYSNVQGRIHYVANDMYTGLSNKKVYPYLSSIFEVDGIKYVPVSPSEHICDAIDCTYTGDELKINKKVNYKGVDMTVREINPYIACCAKIKKVYIENGFTTIGDYAFSYCRALTSVTIPNSVTTIGDGAFSYCNNLTSVTIPNSVTTIGNSAFKNCSSLTSVTIPNSVTTIDRWVFSSCSSLTSVTIGNSVTTIVDNAFDNTYNKTKIIWLTNTPPDGYRNVGGDIHYVANDLYTGLSNKKVYPYLSSIFEVDGIKYVPVSPSERTCDAIDCAYTGEPYEVKINKKVNYKGVDMTVREFNPYTAYECAKIKKAYIDIGGSIGNDAFSGCTNLTSVDIKKANDIGNNAFSKCTNLVSVDIKAGNNIGESAFSNCSSLETLSLDNKIKSLGRSAFENCRNLKQFVIPDSVTILNYLLLYDCSSLKSIRIHKSIKEIDKAFNGCTNLSTLIIEDRNTPLKIVSNNNPLFKDCKLDSVYIGGKIVYETSSDYGYSPFYRNTSLRTVKISDAETTIYDNEFYGCTNLQNVSIGDNVKSIGKWAFSACSSLKNFTFGSGLQSIGQEAFSDCINITKISSEAVVPPTCGINALDDINKWNCKLFVPKANINAYKQAPQWKEFFFIESTTGITNTVYNKAGLADVYTIDGTKRLSKASTDEINALPKGVYIVNGKKIIIR